MMATTVTRARMTKKRTLAQDIKTPGIFILQKGGLGSVVWVTKLMCLSSTSASLARYSGLGCSSSGSGGKELRWEEDNGVRITVAKHVPAMRDLG